MSSYGILWIVTHRFDVVNTSYCSRSTRVLSIRNCAKCLNKANTARWGMTYIFSITYKCPFCSYNGTVALKIKLNNQVRWKIDNLYISQNNRKNIITLSNWLVFKYVWYETSLFIFSLKLMSMELSYDFLTELY